MSLSVLLSKERTTMAEGTCGATRIRIDGNILTTTTIIDRRPSSTGKTKVLVSTEGIQPVDGLTYDGAELYCTVCVGEKRKK
jgi:hypothetical protein